MRKWKLLLETIPAILLLFMAFLTTVSAVSRYLINTPVPDEYEISRMLLGIVVCWGVAAAFYYNDHIYLDVMWGRMSTRAKLILTRIGTLLSLLIMGSYSVALWFKVLDTMRAGILTIDLGVSVWGFQFAAWLGTVAAVIILLTQMIWPSTRALQEHPLEQAI
ncbi:TRAP transporter small permease [Pseudaminobacter arsenicus]|uniref:TRAP transporter small permease protein n=1 Tax=Borborobacter arsenicus TaxID=1851146 RepID=A0A432V054_9HYPH|nr:TRAP transporter small permease [Pseudaminobacter arsenicus]RUM95432.1 TRAP transporter small permease [Pseudaminobacter arsenicus]